MNATLPSTRPVIAVPLLPFPFLSAPWRGFSMAARLPGDGGRTELTITVGHSASGHSSVVPTGIRRGDYWAICGIPDRGLSDGTRYLFGCNATAGMAGASCGFADPDLSRGLAEATAFVESAERPT